ncbi:MAG: phosphatase PAP2 family protein [Pseudomonadota bacterium]
MDILHNLQWVLPLRSPALTQLAFGLSWLGYSTFIMFFVVLGYWTWSKAIFHRLLLLVAVNALLNAYIKDYFQDPRPPLELRLDDLVGASYGIPSGHAQLAVVIWLWLAWELRRTWAWVLGSAIALGVIASRMYLGVHDLEDVLVGAALGGASLLVFERMRRHHWLWRRSATWGAVLIAACTALALLTWPGGAPPEYIPTLAGWSVVAIWGLHWDKQHIGYQVPVLLWHKLAVGLLGTACFVGEQKLLKLLAVHMPMEPVLWALIKGLLGGAFVSLLMPWVFSQLRFAQPASFPSTVASN